MILDEVWVIVLPGNKGVLCDEYNRVFTNHNPRHLWANIHMYNHEFYDLKGNCLGVGMTQNELQKEGYRARKVKIVFD